MPRHVADERQLGRSDGGVFGPEVVLEMLKLLRSQQRVNLEGGFPGGMKHGAIEEGLLGELQTLVPSSTVARGHGAIGVDLTTLNRIRASEGGVQPQLKRIGDPLAGTSTAISIGGKRSRLTFGSEDIPDGDDPYDGSPAISKRIRSDIEQMAGSFDHDLAADLVSKTFAERWLNVELKAKGFLHAAIAKTFLLTPVTLQNCEAMVDNNITLPMNFLIFRPDMTFLTRPIVWMVRGSETGNVLYGRSLFTWGDDGDLRRWKGKFTFYLDAFVAVPDNVVIIDSAHVDMYLGGLTTVAHNMWEPSNPHASCYVLSQPVTASDYQLAISITGRPEKFGRTLNELMPPGGELQYHDVWYYRQLYGFNSDGAGEQDETDMLSYAQRPSRHNAICHQGKANSFFFLLQFR